MYLSHRLTRTLSSPSFLGVLPFCLVFRLVWSGLGVGVGRYVPLSERGVHPFHPCLSLFITFLLASLRFDSTPSPPPPPPPSPFSSLCLVPGSGIGSGYS
jgi:hypothetical protein